MKNQTENTSIPWEFSMKYDAFVIGLFGLVLIASIGLKSWVETKTNIFTDLDANLSLSYPAQWSTKIEKGTLLSIQDLLSEGVFKAKFSVKVEELELTEDVSVQDFVQPYTEGREQDFSAYRILKISDTEINKLNGVMISYAYVDDPISNTFQTFLPTVVKGVDILVIHRNKLYIFSFAAPAANFSQYSNTLDAIIHSVKFDMED